MNLHAPARYAERVLRLAAGVEPVDALRASRVVPPLFVAREVPLDERRWTTLARTREDPFLSLERLDRHPTCRHVLVYREGLYDAADPRITIRLVEGVATASPRRFVPRRLSLPLVDPEALRPGTPPGPRVQGFRIWRPHLLPGAAYPVHETATALRGRVVRDGEPVRWARVEAHNEGDELVGRAHGDDRGEFFLILGSAAAAAGDPRTTVDLTVTVAGTPAAPEPEATPTGRLRARVDPLWDLPVEVLPDSETTDPVSRGEVLPDGYTTERSWLLEGVAMGRITSHPDAFDIA